MHLYRKQTVRGLNPISAANSLDLCCKFRLILRGSYVLDYGVAEDDIEAPVIERQKPAIARDLSVRTDGSAKSSGQVKQGELRLNGGKLPDLRRTTDV